MTTYNPAPKSFAISELDTRLAELYHPILSVCRKATSLSEVELAINRLLPTKLYPNGINTAWYHGGNHSVIDQRETRVPSIAIIEFGPQSSVPEGLAEFTNDHPDNPSAIQDFLTGYAEALSRSTFHRSARESRSWFTRVGDLFYS
jgi:hypothetical protein